MHKLYKNKAIIFSLVCPGLLLFFGVVLVPIILSFYYSLTDFSGLSAAKFVGFENYANLLKDPVFIRSLRNSLILALAAILFQHPLAMLTAIVLDRLPHRFENLLRCVFFIPDVISVAIIAELWRFIYNPNYGLLKKVLEFFGYTQPFNALGVNTALYAVIFVTLWHGFGWAMLIFYAGIKNIDPQQYEASALDGASGLKEFFYITLPEMKPIILYHLIQTFVTSLKTMEIVYQMTNGGPMERTQFIAVYLYKQGFTNYRYGYGSAIGIVLVVACIVSTVVLKALFREKEAD